MLAVFSECNPLVTIFEDAMEKRTLLFESVNDLPTVCEVVTEAILAKDPAAAGVAAVHDNRSTRIRGIGDLSETVNKNLRTYAGKADLQEDSNLRANWKDGLVDQIIQDKKTGLIGTIYKREGENVIQRNSNYDKSAISDIEEKRICCATTPPELITAPQPHHESRDNRNSTQQTVGPDSRHVRPTIDFSHSIHTSPSLEAHLPAGPSHLSTAPSYISSLLPTSILSVSQSLDVSQPVDPAIVPSSHVGPTTDLLQTSVIAYDYSLHDRLLTIAGPTGSLPLAVDHYAESRSVIDPVYGSSLHDRPAISLGPTSTLAHSEFFDPLLDHMLAAPRAGKNESSRNLEKMQTPCILGRNRQLTSLE
ncbi:Uncharacterized protein Fot_29673 [Forsythia ovata]|uniref:Uncharacterized protein n=1 Tax=Forsythia ovata TaxID=205694 RepID=A0ABD1TSK6_9LAMI